MKWALKNMGHTLLEDPCIGYFLQSYDPEYEGGAGEVVWTPDISKARLFDDMIKAMHCWKQISATVPTRWDGKPNRPLTAWSVMPVKVEEEE